MYSIVDKKIIIGGREYSADPNSQGNFLLDTEFSDFENITFTVPDFPENLVIYITNIPKSEIDVFDLTILCRQDNFIEFGFTCIKEDYEWNSKWSLSTFLTTLKDIIIDSGTDIIIYNFEVKEDTKILEIGFKLYEDFLFDKAFTELANKVSEFIRQTVRILSGIVWKLEYESDEKLFCTELLHPLLLKMGFSNVRYTHGQKEYGKDFTFSELTKFGNWRHFGLQAKAGNISGKVNSEIDEIIGQLDDSFSMQYHELSVNEVRQISTFVVAISGRFAENAKDKIRQKIPKYLKGAVYFIDRDQINELIERYWN